MTQIGKVWHPPKCRGPSLGVVRKRTTPCLRMTIRNLGTGGTFALSADLFPTFAWQRLLVSSFRFPVSSATRQSNSNGGGQECPAHTEHSHPSKTGLGGAPADSSSLPLLGMTSVTENAHPHAFTKSADVRDTRRCGSQCRRRRIRSERSVRRSCIGAVGGAGPRLRDRRRRLRGLGNTLSD